MQDEKRPLLQELAYYLHKRNQIEIRRRRAKSKISYYEDIKRTIKEYKSALFALNAIKREMAVLQHNGQEWMMERKKSELLVAQTKVDSFNKARNRPFKFLDRVSELNKRILKHKADYTRARYDTAKLTCSTRKRVFRLTQLLRCTIDYQMGTAFVQSIGFKDGESESVPHRMFEVLGREYEANKAVEKMLRSKHEEKEDCKEES